MKSEKNILRIEMFCEELKKLLVNNRSIECSQELCVRIFDFSDDDLLQVTEELVPNIKIIDIVKVDEKYFKEF